MLDLLQAVRGATALRRSCVRPAALRPPSRRGLRVDARPSNHPVISPRLRRKPGASGATSLDAGALGFMVCLSMLTGVLFGLVPAFESARADLELRKLEQQRQDQLNLIVLELKTAAAQLESARSEVEVANSAVDLAREEVNQARDRFLAGVVNNIEVITAQDAFSRANDNTGSRSRQARSRGRPACEHDQGFAAHR